jgi:hypothetical protein
MTADFMFIHQTSKTGELINAIVKKLLVTGLIDFSGLLINFNQVFLGCFFEGCHMFRGARLIFWFDIWVIFAGIGLFCGNWQPLTGFNAVATIVEANPRCTYSRYIHKPKKGHYYERPPAVSGQCVQSEKEALSLLNGGYNQVSKRWDVTATIGENKRRVEFKTETVNELVYKEHWEGFLWGHWKLEPGDQIYVLRSLTGFATTQLREPQKTTDRVLAFYKVVLGLLFCLGTLAIHWVPYWQMQNRKNA